MFGLKIDRATFQKDFIAGLTVAVVALPLALGFGITSGISASAGLITAIPHVTSQFDTS